MLAEELTDLVREVQKLECEQNNIELKIAHDGCPRKLYDTLSAFSNTDGGIIIFGIDEKDYSVCGVYDPQDLQKKVGEQCAQMEPPVRAVFTAAEIEGSVVVSCEVQQIDVSERPCFYTGAGRLKGSYIRVGDRDERMSEYEIYSYEMFRKKIYDDTRCDERMDMDTLDIEKLKFYISKLKQNKPNLSKFSDQRICELRGITKSGAPTLCGQILFGVYPQAFFPMLCVTAVIVPGTEVGVSAENDARFLDNKKFEGTVSEMYEETMGFISRNMRTPTLIDKNGHRVDTTEYPIKAIREIVLNALIHRDYSIHTESSPIRVLMYTDRLVVESPGGLYGRLTVDNLGKVGADTRNPYIASALETLLDTENRFSGIPTIYHEMKAAGLKPPKFENLRNAFRVTLFNERNVIENAEPLGEIDEILKFCSVPRSRTEIAGHFGYSNISYFVKNYITPLINEGKLCMTIPEKPKSKFQKYYSPNLKQ